MLWKKEQSTLKQEILWWSMFGINTKHKNLIYLLPLILLVCLALYQALDFKIHDFGNYYYGGKALASGLFDHTIYNALDFNELIETEYLTNSFVSYYPNTPSLALIFSPLSYLPWPVCKLLFNVFSVVSFIIALSQLCKKGGLPNYFIALVALVFLVPIRNNILFGQCYLLLFSLFYFGFEVSSKRKWSITHFSWPLAVLLKSSPIVLFALPLLNKNYKGLLYLLSTLVGLLLLSLVFIDINTWVYYVEDVFLRASKGDIYNGFSPRAKSLEMLLKQLFVYDPVLNPNPIYDHRAAYLSAKFGLKIFVFLLVVKLSLNTRLTDLQKMGGCVLLLLLFSPTLSSYSMILLIFPLVGLWTKTSILEKSIATALLLIICFSQQIYVLDDPLLLKFLRALCLLLFFGFYFFAMTRGESVGQKIGYKEIGIPLLFVVLTWLMVDNEIPIKNDYVLTEEPAIMMKDFRLDGNSLACDYLTGKGVETFHYPLGIKVQSSKTNTVQSRDLSLQNYVQDLHLRKSVLINDSILFYMSDEYRSPGFYTLRKLIFDEKK